MAKEELIEMSGMVTDVLPDSRFRVTLDNGHQLVAYTGGKMRKHHIRILAGDKVSLEMSPYDLTKGRITFGDRAPPWVSIDAHRSFLRACFGWRSNCSYSCERAQSLTHSCCVCERSISFRSRC